MVSVRRILALNAKDGIVRDQAMRRGEVVYGSQALKAHLGLGAREPGDWDVFSKNPKRSAYTTERILDGVSGGDYYFTRRATHKGTWKVQEIGPDNKKLTDDDIQVADYTKIPRGIRKGIAYGGLPVIDLESIERDKIRSINNPMFKYRRDKDSEDLQRIRRFKLLR